jgi:hypothetical protein
MHSCGEMPVGTNGDGSASERHVWRQQAADSAIVVGGAPAGRRQKRVDVKRSKKLAFSHASTSASVLQDVALTSRQPQRSNQQWSSRASWPRNSRTKIRQARCTEGNHGELQWWPCYGRQLQRNRSGQACTLAPAQIEGRSEPDTCLKYLAIYM